MNHETKEMKMHTKNIDIIKLPQDMSPTTNIVLNISLYLDDEATFDKEFEIMKTWIKKEVLNIK